MFFQQFLACSRAGRLCLQCFSQSTWVASGIWFLTATPLLATTRLRISRSISHSFFKKLLTFDFRDHHDFFGPQVRIVHTHRYRAPVVDCRMTAYDFFDVLRIDILATDNQKVFLAANHEEFSVQIEAEIAAVIPAIDERLAP